MVTSPDEWKILEWDENPKQNNMLWGDKIKKKMEFSQFHKLSYFTLNFPKVLIKVTTSFLLNCWSIWIQLSYYRFGVILVHCYRVIALGLSIRCYFYTRIKTSEQASKKSYKLQHFGHHSARIWVYKDIYRESISVLSLSCPILTDCTDWRFLWANAFVRKRNIYELHVKRVFANGECVLDLHSMK